MQEYFFLDAQNQRQGPYAGELLPTYGVTATTLVWKQGMADWQQAGQVEELASLFGSHTAPSNYPLPEQNPYAQAGQNNAATGGSYQPQPDNWLVWAVLVTLCCCMPFGIVAIYKSAKVNPYYESGAYAQAQQAAGEAKKWVIIGAVCGLIFQALYLVFVLAMGTGFAGLLEGM
ncbi:MAG: CD225/dispanin family protein [Alloprevotella sp.]|nr:CD225/dispanin family protein [Alloprevotella sp.]